MLKAKQLTQSKTRLTDANYQIALNALEDRYGGMDMEANEHQSKLESLKAVTDPNDVEKLRKLIDSLLLHTRALDNLGVECSSYAVSVYPKIFRCVPQSLGILFGEWYESEKLAKFEVDINCFVTRKVSEFSALIEFLTKQVESREKYFTARDFAEKRESVVLLSRGRTQSFASDNSRQRHAASSGGHRNGHAPGY